MKLTFELSYLNHLSMRWKKKVYELWNFTPKISFKLKLCAKSNELSQLSKVKWKYNLYNKCLETKYQ